MKTNTKEVKETSKSLKKRKGTRENNLYLNWEDKPILTKRQLLNVLGYWGNKLKRGTQYDIIWKKGGKENNRLRPIFLLSQFFNLLPQKIQNYLYRKIGEYSYYQTKGIKRGQIPTILLSSLFLSFLLSLLITLLLLSQKTYAYIDEETMAHDTIRLWEYIIPAILLSGVFFYVCKFIRNHRKKKCSEGQRNIVYSNLSRQHFKWLLEKVKISFFHIIIVPISFLWRLIVRAFIHQEGFMNIFLRSYLLNPFHRWLLLNWLYDRLSRKDSYTNLLLVWKVWGGKSSWFAIPNLLKLDNCSILTVDISGELFLKTSWAMKAKWYEVKILNPTNLWISEKYNPLAFVSDHKSISEIAHILIHSSHSSKWDSFWNNGAMKLLEILIACLVLQRQKLKKSGIKDYSKFCTLSQLRYLLNNFGENGEWLDKFISTYADYGVFHDWRGFISWNEKTTAWFVATALISLNIVWNEEVAKLTSSNTINFKELRKKKVIYYLQVPWHLLHVYSVLISIFYTQFFNSCMENLPNKKDLDVVGIIDEAGQIRMGKNFPTVITTSRKYRLSLALLCQNSSQLHALYWDDAQTIIHWWIANHIYLWGCDLKTCESLEKMMWNVIAREVDWLWRMIYVKEPLRTISEIRTLRDNEAIYLNSSKKPIMLYMTPYYKHYYFKKLSELKLLEFDGIKNDGRLCYMDLESITEDWEVAEVNMKLQETEEEIDNLNNNSDFKINELSQEQYQNYLDAQEWPLFDIRSLDEKTRTLIEIVKEKIIYCHLNKSFDDISIPIRFHIKKRVKEIMDLPDYFQRLEFIRNSVCGRVDKILNPPEPERHSFESYSDMCHYRKEHPEQERNASNVVGDYPLLTKKFNPYSWIWDVGIIPWEWYTAYCDRVGR